MAVDIAVDQKDISRFIDLQKNPGKPSDSTFTLALPDNSVYAKPGYISLLDRAIDPQTGTIKTRLIFNNTAGQLKAGMNTTLRVRNNNAGLFLMAPYKAVLEQMGEFFVFVVNDSSKVSQKKISLGTRIGDKIIIKDGLQEGDKVVTEGIQKLKEGTKVMAASPKANK